MGKASNVFGKIVVWLLTVVLIVAFAAAALLFVLRVKGITYYVEYDRQRYVGGTDNGEIFLLIDEPHDFSVKSLTGDEIDFDVKITSNADSDITFIYNDEFLHLYNCNIEKDDYSDILGLQVDADGFSVTIPQGMTIEKAIETKYGGDVTFLDELSDNTAYFVIVVTVGENSVELPFAFGAKISDVTLSPPSIVF